MSNDTCKHCKHSLKNLELERTDLNVCRRFPPTSIVLPKMVRITGNAPPFDVKYVQPLVNDSMTCGEFAMRLAVLN